MFSTLNRALALALAMVTLVSIVTVSPAQEDKITSRDRVLRDPDIPVLGNPNGDVTIVEFFDYQCPFCKKLSPELADVIKKDGKVRLVLKDWPILGAPSPYAAQLVLATKYQDKYEAAHDALMARVGRLTEGTLEETLAGAGVDVSKAKADLETHKGEIDDLLKRNNDQAEAFGFNSTPSFIVGTFRIPMALTAEQFQLAIADARKLAKNGAAKPAAPKSEKQKSL